MSELLGVSLTPSDSGTPLGPAKDNLMEKMIDYIVNHKNNLNGIILLQMLNHLESAGESEETIGTAEPAEPSSQIVV